MLRALALLAVVLGLPAGASGGSAAHDPVIIPFTLAEGLIFVDVARPGAAPVLALLDTGASASAVDPRCSQELPVLETSEVVGTTGTLSAETVRVEGWRVGSLELPALRATRRPIHSLAPPGRSVDMILGSDALAGLAVTLDFAAQRLELSARPPEAPAAGVPMLLDNGVPAIEATLEGLATRLRIDTGASLFDTPDVYINIPTRLWSALRERHPGIAPSTAFKGTGADGQSVDLPVAEIAGCTVGPLELERAFVIVQPEAGYFADPQAKGFVGNNFLRRLGRVTLDYGAGRLRWEPAEQNRWAEPVRHARAIIEAYRTATGVPALQVAVAVDGRIAWSEAFGVADRASGRAVTTQSRFRIASVSKLLTGTLTAKLAEAGALDLDRPIGEFVPELPAAWHDITARRLVHHTSGIAHYSDPQDALDTTFYATTRAAIARFADRPLAHAPGAGETYSSYAYTLLALVIEQATGRPFLETMEAEILRPLRMTRTGPDLRASPPPDLTAFYNLAEDGTIEDAAVLDLSGRWAGSGYLSTAEDLARFGSAHTTRPGELNGGPGVLPAGVVALVAQRDALPDGTLTKEGFGWGPRTDWDGRAMLFGDGSTPGSRCGLLVYPDDGVAIAVVTNLRGLALERGELQTLARLFLAAREGQPLLPPAEDLAGEWRGSVMVGETSLAIRLDLRAGEGGVSGTLAMPGWRTLAIADAFRLGDTTWLIPVDRQGVFPCACTTTADALSMTAFRTGWVLSLSRDAGAGAPR